MTRGTRFRLTPLAVFCGAAACFAPWVPRDATPPGLHPELPVTAQPIPESLHFLGPSFLVAALLWAFLAVYGGRWIPAPPPVTSHSLPKPPPPARRWRWRWRGAMLLAALTALALRWPLMERSIGNDEQMSLALNVHGYWEARGSVPPTATDGSGPGPETAARWITQNGKWLPASWRDTFFTNGGQNNSTPYSVAARLCADAWRLITGGAPGTCSVPATRVPALAAGLLGVCVMFHLVADRAGILPGFAAALLLACNPHHMEFSARARGYSLMILLLLLALWWLVRAIREGGNRWRWFHGAVIGMVFVFPGAVYAGLALETVGLAALLRQKDGLRSRLGAWFSAGVLLSAALAPLALPNLLQSVVMAKRGYIYTRIPPRHLERLWNIHMLGLSYPKGPPNFTLAPAWDDPEDAAQPARALSPLARAARGGGVPGSPEENAADARILWLKILSQGVLPLLLVIGSWRLWKRCRVTASAVSAVFAAAVLAVLHQRFVLGVCGFYWYYLYAVPAVCICLAMLIAGRGEAEGPFRKWGRRTAATGMYAFLIHLSWPDGTGWRFDYAKDPGPVRVTLRQWSPGDRWLTYASGHTLHSLRSWGRAGRAQTVPPP